MKQRKKIVQYSLDEIANAHILSEELSAVERKQILEDFGKKKKKLDAQLSNEQRILSAILQLRFQIEDYIKEVTYDQDTNFGFFLKQYISRLQLKNKDFAYQIGVEPVELSQLLNAHRRPNNKILIRLEIHSNNNIDALLWYKIVEKDKEYELVTNTRLRQQEKRHVKQYFSYSK
ncbi:MAG: hypothetical protein P0Y53_04140 [Candidatus Pseudobacter hemicellulosilyticus]|uniref:Uncharacterized protein n=1 Tax=Candidatus Pseudobacter hemicellulosilyticus TaxID=3121375 RepID=A0AAJ5WUA3_9BACT|nr:MAG: hypothetical protein P0Y53_04140 [Pseudobacter sp.]